MYKDYYILAIWDDITPELLGPFSIKSERDKKAQSLRFTDPNKEDGLYLIETDKLATIKIDTYCGLDSKE